MNRARSVLSAIFLVMLISLIASSYYYLQVNYPKIVQSQEYDRTIEVMENPQDIAGYVVYDHPISYGGVYLNYSLKENSTPKLREIEVLLHQNVSGIPVLVDTLILQPDWFETLSEEAGTGDAIRPPEDRAKMIQNSVDRVYCETDAANAAAFNTQNIESCIQQDQSIIPLARLSREQRHGLFEEYFSAPTATLEDLVGDSAGLPVATPYYPTSMTFNQDRVAYTYYNPANQTYQGDILVETLGMDDEVWIFVVDTMNLTGGKFNSQWIPLGASYDSLVQKGAFSDKMIESLETHNLSIFNDEWVHEHDSGGSMDCFASVARSTASMSMMTCFVLQGSDIHVIQGWMRCKDDDQCIKEDYDDKIEIMRDMISQYVRASQKIG